MATQEGKEISDPKPPLGSGSKAYAQIERKRFAKLSSCAQSMWSFQDQDHLELIRESQTSRKHAGRVFPRGQLLPASLGLSVHPRIERLEAEHTI